MQQHPKISRRLTRVVLLSLLIVVGVILSKRLYDLQHEAPQILLRTLQARLGHPLEVSQVIIHPWGKITFRETKLLLKGFPQVPLFTAPQVEVKISLWGLLLNPSNLEGSIDQVKLLRPQFYLSRSSSGRWNFQQILKPIPGRPPSRFQGVIGIQEGQLRIRDAFPYPYLHSPLELRFLHLQGQIQGEPLGGLTFAFSGTSPSTGFLRLTGTYSSAQREGIVHLSGDHLPLDSWQKRIKTRLPLTIARGIAQITLTIPIHQGKLQLSRITGQLQGGRIDLVGKPLRKTLALPFSLLKLYDQKLYLSAQGRLGNIPFSTSGSIFLKPKPFCNLGFRLLIPTIPSLTQSLSLPDRLQPLPQSGRLLLEGRVTGAPSSLQNQGRFVFSHLQWKNFSLSSGQGTFRLTPQLLEIPSLSAQISGGTLLAKGTIALNQHPLLWKISGSINLLPLHLFPIRGIKAEGQISGRYSLAGRGENFTLTMEGRGDNIILPNLRTLAARFWLRTEGGRQGRFSIAAKKGQYKRWPWDSANLQGTWRGSEFQLTTSHFYSAGGHLSFQGLISEKEINGRGRADNLPLRLLFPDGQKIGLSGTFSSSFQISGPRRNPSIAGTAFSTQFHYRNLVLDRFAFQFQGNLLQMTLQKGFIKTQRGQATFTGSLSLLSGPPPLLGINATYSNVSLAPILQSLKIPLKGEAIAEGQIKVTGTPFSPEVTGSITARDLRLGDFPPLDSAEGIIFYRKGSLVFTQMRVQKGEAYLHGAVSLRHNLLSLSLAGQNLPLREFSPFIEKYASIDGKGDVTLRLQGPLKRLVFEGLIDAKPLVLNRSIFDHAQGIFTLAPQYREVKNLLLAQSEGSLQVKDFQWDLLTQSYKAETEFSQIPLKPLLESLEQSPYLTSPGASNLREFLSQLPRPFDARLSGRWLLVKSPKSIESQGIVEAASLTLGTERFRSAHLNFHLDTEGLYLTDAVLSGKDFALQAFGQAAGPAPLNLRVTLTQTYVPSLLRLVKNLPFLEHHPSGKRLLQWIRRIPSSVGGYSDLSLQLTGQADNPSGTALFNLAKLRVANENVDSIQAHLDLADRRLYLRSLIATSREMTLRATGQTLPNGELDFSLDARNVELSTLAKLAGFSLPLRGQATINVDIKGDPSEPQVIASAFAREVNLEKVSFDAVSLSGVTLKNNRLIADRLVLSKQGYELSAYGSVPIETEPFQVVKDQPLDLYIAVEQQDLGFLKLLSPMLPATLPPSRGNGVLPPELLISEASGPVTGNLHITGTPENPWAEGFLAVQKGKIQFARSQTTLENLEARIDFLGDRVVISQFVAKNNLGGQLLLTGQASLNHFPKGPVKVELVSQGFKVSAQNLTGMGEQLLADLNSHLLLEGSLNNPRLTGDLRLLRGRAILPVETTLEKASFIPLLPLETQIRVLIGPEFEMRRGPLRALLSGQFNFQTQRDKAPLLTGNLVVERGEVRLAIERFRLDPGGTISITYQPPLPLRTNVSLVARSTVRALSPATGQRERYQIRIALSGPLENPHLEATSDPPDLSQMQILAVVGHIPSLQALMQGGPNAERIFREELARVFTGAVLPQVIDPMTEAFARALGLSELTLVVDFGAPVELLISKDIGTHWMISLRRFLAGPRQDFQAKVGYRITRQLQLGFLTDDRGVTAYTLEGSLRF